MKTLGSILCTAVLALGFTACNPAPDGAAVENDETFDDAGRTAADEGRTDGTAGTSGTADDLVRLAEIAGNPADYVGRTVTVEADVEEVFGPRAFALDEDAFFRAGIDNDVLVLGKDTTGLAAIDDQWLNNKVRVTGTVGRMAVVDIERELGWDLDPQIEAELERSGAVLFASSVQRSAQDGAGAANRRGSNADERAQAGADLPDTASPLALAGIMGLLALGGAVGLRAYRQTDDRRPSA